MPQILAGLRIAICAPELIYGSKVYESTTKHIGYSVLILISVPLLRPYLLLKKHYIEQMIHIDGSNKELISKWDKVEYHLCHFIKLELGLETIFQLCGQFLLLLKTSQRF